jgi:uncharacterized integral membrane protein (TIGR00698 family)
MQRNLFTAHAIRKVFYEVIRNYPAILIILVSGTMAYVISTLDPAFDALFMALFLGILFGSLYRSERKDVVAQKALSVTLPVGIILYGTNIVFPKGVTISPEYIALSLLSTLILGLSVLYLARLNGIGSKFTTLLTCGNAICGASAIAIISSIINPKKEEFSASIIIITVVGLTGAVVYPSVNYIIGLPDYKYALLSGATLQQTGLVKIATSPFSDNLINFALAIKAVRIAMIAVVALIVSFIYSDHRFYVPWYIVAFIAMAFLSENILPEAIVRSLQPLSTLAFALTLSSIGFSVNLSDIQNVRITPLIVVYVGWLFSVIVVILLMSLI